MLFGLVLTSASAVAAQSTPTTGDASPVATDVDIAAISEAVLEADPETLVEALATPPDDSDLPEGFLNPASGTPENADLVDAFTSEIAEIEGTVGNVNQAFDTDPSVVPGLISAGVLTYIVTDEEITSDDLDDFEEGAGGGFEGEAAGSEGSVDRITVGDTDAVLITVSTEESGVTAVVQIVALPVGNTMVIGTVVVADQGEVLPDDVLPFAEELTLAGASHLGTVAEDA
jgi:hypothetical protein